MVAIISKVYCEFCGAPLFDVPYASKLRKAGFCMEHLGQANITPRKKPHREKKAKPPKYINPTNGNIDYKIYLQSDEWRKKSIEAKKKVGWRCQVCNRHGDHTTLHAHHRTYQNLGHEKPGDITVLCDDCHSKFHDILPRGAR
jgi:5-methylcytosine-specific restriction endonuclease McrA